MVPIKRVAAINDISCFGKCSLTVALPVLSAFGVETVPIPTALLSMHTGLPDYYFCDLTEHTQNIVNHFISADLKFDCIYTGFLGSAEQIGIVDRFISRYPDALVIVDPVMGDNGKIYTTYTAEMCEKMKLLVKRADVITPNVTEAAILLGEDYTVASRSAEEMRDWVKRLLDFGVDAAVITGFENRNAITAFAAKRSGETAEASVPLLPINISGTGDLFSARFTAEYMTSGENLKSALETACTFVHNCLSDTLQSGRDPLQGVLFENRLR